MKQTTPGANACARSAEGPVLLHIWMVDPAKADDHVRSLSTLFRRASIEPGFISAQVLESPDRASIAALVQMRTAEDRHRLEQLPEVSDILHNLQGTVNLVVRLYHQTAAF